MLEYYVENASTYGESIDNLFLLITVIVGFWFLLVEAIIFYLIFRFRKKEGVKAKYIAGEQHHETRWIHIPHYLVILCDIVIIVYTIIVWNDIKLNLPPAEENIRIIGVQWAWIFIHPGADGKLDTEDDIATVNDLHVKVDTIYHFELEAKDVLHSFSIPVFRLKQDAIPGRTVTGWFEPTKTGEFDIQCAEMCGIGHGIMAARVMIETPEAHNEWIASQNHSDFNELLSARMNTKTSKIGEITWMMP